MGLICQWIEAHERSGMNKNQREKYERDLVYLNSKETSFKSGKKYKNYRQAEYHHTLKRKKNSVNGTARDSSLRPLVYEASALPTELSFRMKS